MDQPNPAWIAGIGPLDVCQWIAEQPAAVMLFFPGDIFQPVAVGIAGGEEAFVQFVGKFPAEGLQVNCSRRWQRMAFRFTNKFAHPVRQAVVHWRRAIGQRHQRMVTYRMQPRMDFWLIMDENREFAEITLHALLHVGLVIDIGWRFWCGVCRFEDNVQHAGPFPVGQIQPGFLIQPAGSRRLHGKRAEQAMDIGAVFIAAHVSDIVDGPDAFGIHCELDRAVIIGRARKFACFRDHPAVGVARAIVIDMALHEQFDRPG
ncbi:hypothetical protein [Novosphingobium sp. B 225]|uniref:hypothetical protein n=1 Tax=Novosphingobium sp. B 225 TaxID=1961849 RepID=UPI001124EBBB|nr:hypothetical protein [Novosphingobium sp. B 225]